MTTSELLEAYTAAKRALWIRTGAWVRGEGSPDRKAFATNRDVVRESLDALAAADWPMVACPDCAAATEVGTLCWSCLGDGLVPGETTPLELDAPVKT